MSGHSTRSGVLSGCRDELVLLSRLVASDRPCMPSMLGLDQQHGLRRRCECIGLVANREASGLCSSALLFTP